MGLSSKSKRLQRNRAARRVNYYPKELKRLKQTLTFKWDEKNRKAHLSMFHDLMNGPPPAVPGCEEGSGLERLHLTQTDVSADRVENILKKRLERAISGANLALDKEAMRALLQEKDSPKKKIIKIDPDVKLVYNEKTMKDQFGRYAPWMSQKAIKKLNEGEKEEKWKAKMKQQALERSRGRRKNKRKVVRKTTDVEMKEDK